MNIKISIFVLSILLSMGTVKAQKTTAEITNKFFKTYKNSPNEALDYLFSTMIIRWYPKESNENLRSNLFSFIKTIGKYQGYEEIVTKSIGTSYKLISFMLKYERQPIRFTFILYKPKDKWHLQDFEYDSKLSKELKSAAKIDKLQQDKQSKIEPDDDLK